MNLITCPECGAETTEHTVKYWDYSQQETPAHPTPDGEQQCMPQPLSRTDQEDQ